MTDPDQPPSSPRHDAAEPDHHGDRAKRPESLAEILRQLKDDPFVVGEWYQKPDDDDVCESLVRALEDPAPPVRRAAAQALVALDDLYASTSIYGVLHRGSQEARLTAISVLGMIGRGDPIAIRQVEQAAVDPDPAVATVAQCALVKMTGQI